ncbi:MAG TPA: serine/threonine-protein kinase [Gemmatimonadaceae bacterium]|nr:serine/threonine-protein kinase [Gemmatimonadaceae bacterium]
MTPRPKVPPLAKPPGPIQRVVAALPERYAFKSLIGRGSAAYVILADDRQLQTPVAVKILRPEVATVVGEKRFHREVEILSRLEHANILRLLDHGTVQHQGLFLVTPFINGETLRARLRRERQVSVTSMIPIVQQIASALDYAHARDVIHRDIKPANILLPEGAVILADFGISRAMGSEQTPQITVTGVSVGTPEYMSPEQISAGSLDARSDIYSLGCVAYEMLSGKPPFTGRTYSEIFHRHRNETPRPVTETRPDVPIKVDAAIMKSLAKDRAERFKTAGEFAEALAAAGKR